MTRTIWVAVAALLMVTVFIGMADAQAGRVEHVFIVSLDGLRPDVLAKARTPNIDNLVLVGSYSWTAQTVLPSVTLPSHVSMLTGVLPEIHGVTWNDYRPARGPIPVPTIFTIAHSSGLSTAMVVAKDKLQTLALDGSLDYAEVVGGDAMTVAQAASRPIEASRPNLFWIHFADPDAAGHRSGWGSDAQVRSAEACDRGVGILLGAIHRAGIANTSVMIVTADHGGHGDGHGSDSEADRTIPWIIAGTGVTANKKIQERVSTCDTAAMALWALGVQPPADWYGRVIPGVFPTR